MTETLSFVNAGGPFAWAILLLVLLVLGLAGRLARALAAGRPVPARGLDPLLFWGFASALLGLLGQALGIYNAMGAILRATEISPAVVLRGFRESFTTALLGLGALALSGLAWWLLRAWRLRGDAAAAGR